LSMENLVQESNKILESSQQADISVKSGLSGTGIILILGSELTGRQKYYDHALRIADYIMEMNPFEPGRGTIKGMYYSNTRKEQSYMDPSLMTGLSGLGCFYHTLIYRDIDMAFLF